MPSTREERTHPSQRDSSQGKRSASERLEKRSSTVDVDAALARKMQQQIDDEESGRRVSRGDRDSSRRRDERSERKRPSESSERGQQRSCDRQNRSSNRGSSNSRRRSSTERERPPKKPSSSPKRSSARSEEKPRVEKERLVREEQPRELTDEELARRIAEKETLGNLVRLKEGSIPPPTRWTMRRICTLTIPLLVIVAAVVGIVFAFNGGAAAALTGLPPTLQQGDPFLGKSTAELSRWNNGGKGGLGLEVINALDSTWNSEFQLAVNDWDYGSPDALTLTTSQAAAPDTACTQVSGKLKVCNGNYGNTQWLGINEVITSNGVIVSSAARMNDFYLNGAIESQRQYTMCHEIGHGFGLAHTDENFYNKDLGNCLDYTIHPWVNEHPSSMNYNVLVQLYGTVGGRLRGLFAKANAPEVVEHPDWVFAKFEEERHRLETTGYLNADEKGWTLIHRSLFGEGHRLDLGEGYTAHVDILMTPQNVYDNGPR